MRCPFNADFSAGNRWQSAATRLGQYGGCSSVVTLFCVKKYLTKTDQWAGALKWRRNQLLVLHFWGHFLLTTSLRQRRMSRNITSLTVAIPIHYTSEFREVLKLPVLSRLRSFRTWRLVTRQLVTCDLCMQNSLFWTPPQMSPKNYKLWTYFSYNFVYCSILTFLEILWNPFLRSGLEMFYCIEILHNFYLNVLFWTYSYGKKTSSAYRHYHENVGT